MMATYTDGLKMRYDQFLEDRSVVERYLPSKKTPRDLSGPLPTPVAKDSHASLLSSTQLAERLKLSDPRLLERPEQDASLEPDWLLQLRACHQRNREEGSFLGAASTQPEPVKNSGSIPGVAPHSEHAQNQGCLEDLRQQPSDHLPLMHSAQYQAGLDQRLHFHPGSNHPIGTTAASMENSLPVISQDSFSPPGGLPDDLSSSRLHQLSDKGGTQESCGVYHTNDEKDILENQSTLNSRTRSISQSSTISMVEDVSPFSEDTVEEAISENSEAEDAEQEQTKASGFGWFRWFRSKPNRDAEPSRRAPATPLDFSAPVPEEKAALPPTSLPPTSGSRPPKLSPPHLPHAYGNPFPQSSLGTAGTKDSLGLGSKEGPMFSGVGNKDTSSEPHPDPDGRPPPPKGGTVLFFNPSQVAAAAVSGAGHPRQSFHRRYPPYPQ